VGHDPKSDDALVNFAELPWASDNAAPVNDGSEAVGFTIFFDELFSCEFGEPVERARTIERQGLRYSFTGDALSALIIPSKAGFLFGPRMRFERSDGINTAGGKEKKTGIP
jgi:hypothetical protein